MSTDKPLVILWRRDTIVWEGRAKNTRFLILTKGCFQLTFGIEFKDRDEFPVFDLIQIPELGRQYRFDPPIGGQKIGLFDMLDINVTMNIEAWRGGNGETMV